MDNRIKEALDSVKPVYIADVLKPKVLPPTGEVNDPEDAKEVIAHLDSVCYRATSFIQYRLGVTNNG